MENPLFTTSGLYQIFRWIHFMAGVAWIGHLYYFNFVQGPFFAEADAQTKSAAIRGLVPKALWWFRWGAAFTWFSGLAMLWHKGHTDGHAVYLSGWGMWIIIGSMLGTLMAANVWAIIWPAQQVIIASANSVAAGGPADPTAAARGARAAVASRTNVLFSLPMLFFMGAASHLPIIVSSKASVLTVWGAVAVILGLIELNAIFGKTGPMTTIKGVIHSGVALTAILYVAVIALV